MQFVIPKAADLLGPVDLRVNLNPPDALGGMGTGQAHVAESGTAGTAGHVAAFDTRSFAQWVDEVGFAMIEKVTFSVGSNDIETITGEQMQIKNELMTSDEQRLGFDHVMKTGRRAFRDKRSNVVASLAELPGDNMTLSSKKEINTD